MKGILFILVCLVLLCAGCVEQKSANTKIKAETAAAPTATATEKLVVTVTSPHAGQILQGNDKVEFGASVSGGKEPYAYSWSSNIDGVLSSDGTFKQNPSKLSKGGQIIILKVLDAKGNVGQGSVLIEVM
ncbi:MAG: hypothetical protein EHM14_12935 [Methanothrix sp.]|nr:MAG: hypothetical protein EHM14_12935 [Methanothrix sp.]